jgi:hypothetical protein
MRRPFLQVAADLFVCGEIRRPPHRVGAIPGKDAGHPDTGRAQCRSIGGGIGKGL